MSSIFKVGVTGGIGSGKTSVCKVFSTLGVPVFSADNEARIIMDTSEVIREAINDMAGSDLYTEGYLDRQKLAGIIFNDPGLLQRVNGLVHPAVFRSFEEWLEFQSFPYAIMEAAILFESGANELVDISISVIAPVEERIARVMRRNSFSREQVLDRIRNQVDDEKRIMLSDYVISNSENDMIIPAVLKINDEIISRMGGDKS